MGDYDFSYNVIVNSDNKFELKEEYDDDSVLIPYIDFKPNLKYRFHQNDNSNAGNTFKLFYKDQFNPVYQAKNVETIDVEPNIAATTEKLFCISDDGHTIGITGGGTSQKVYIYNYIDGTLTLAFSDVLGTHNGNTTDTPRVACSGDGKTIAVGQYNYGYAQFVGIGIAYVYAYTNNAWSRVQIIQSPVGTPGSNEQAFGSSLALNYNGSYMAIGAINHNLGTGYVAFYSRNSNGITFNSQNWAITGFNGQNTYWGSFLRFHPTAINGDLTIGSFNNIYTNTGPIYICNKNGYTNVGITRPGSDNQLSFFGQDVDFSSDGSVLVISERNALDSYKGAVHVYHEKVVNQNKIDHQFKFTITENVVNDFFGTRIHLNNTGSLLTVTTGGSSNDTLQVWGLNQTSASKIDNVLIPTEYNINFTTGVPPVRSYIRFAKDDYNTSLILSKNVSDWVVTVNRIFDQEYDYNNMTFTGTPGLNGAYTQVTFGTDVSTTDVFYDREFGDNFGHGPITIYDVSIGNATTLFGTGMKYYIDVSDGGGFKLAYHPTMNSNNTYRFNMSDNILQGYDLSFTTIPNKASGYYHQTVDNSGTPGVLGAYTQVRITDTTPTLFYYNPNQDGMGDTNTEYLTVTINKDITNENEKYYISNGNEPGPLMAPTIKLLANNNYYFDVSDPSNSDYILTFYKDTDHNTVFNGGTNGNANTGLVERNLTPGLPGSNVTLGVTEDTPETENPSTSAPSYLYYHGLNINNTSSVIGGTIEVYDTLSELTDSWIGVQTDANRLKHTYVNGFIDISGGDLTVRGSQIQLTNDTDTSFTSLTFDLSYDDLIRPVGGIITNSEDILQYYEVEGTDNPTNSVISYTDLSDNTNSTITQATKDKFALLKTDLQANSSTTTYSYDGTGSSDLSLNYNNVIVSTSDPLIYTHLVVRYRTGTPQNGVSIVYVTLIFYDDTGTTYATSIKPKAVYIIEIKNGVYVHPTSANGYSQAAFTDPYPQETNTLYDVPLFTWIKDDDTYQGINIYGYDSINSKDTILAANIRTTSYKRPFVMKYNSSTNTWEEYATIGIPIDGGNNVPDIDYVTMSYDTKTVAISHEANIYIFYDSDNGNKYTYVSTIDTTDLTGNATHRPTLSGQAFSIDGKRLVVATESRGGFQGNNAITRCLTYNTVDNWVSIGNSFIFTTRSANPSNGYNQFGSWAYISHNGDLFMYATNYDYNNQYSPIEYGMYSYNNNNSWTQEFHHNLFESSNSGGIADNTYSLFSHGGSLLSPDGNYAFIKTTLFKRNGTQWSSTTNAITTSGQVSNSGYNNGTSDFSYITNNGERVIKYIASTDKIHVYDNDGNDSFSEILTIDADINVPTNRWQVIQSDLSYGKIIVSNDPLYDAGTTNGATYIYTYDEYRNSVPTQITNINAVDKITFTIGDQDIATIDTTGFRTTFAKNFEILHPILNNYKLRHTCIESPQLATMYSGHTTLNNGTASINLDTAFHMTEGTFSLLNIETYSLTSNESGFCEVKGDVIGNILTIVCEDNTSNDDISWIVFGKRNDEYVKQTTLLDEYGNYISEF